VFDEVNWVFDFAVVGDLKFGKRHTNEFKLFSERDNFTHSTYLFLNTSDDFIPAKNPIPRKRALHCQMEVDGMIFR
jgi:hypothetical protein